MIFKLFTARAKVETNDTGTYADGRFKNNRFDVSIRPTGKYRSAHERDYGFARRKAELSADARRLSDLHDPLSPPTA
jgi:hypothetical protein